MVKSFWSIQVDIYSTSAWILFLPFERNLISIEETNQK